MSDALQEAEGQVERAARELVRGLEPADAVAVAAFVRAGSSCWLRLVLVTAGVTPGDDETLGRLSADFDAVSSRARAALEPTVFREAELLLERAWRPIQEQQLARLRDPEILVGARSTTSSFSPTSRVRTKGPPGP